MNSTRDTACEVVEGLRNRLYGLSAEDLAGVRSVVVYGSYVRGDWLDSNSDLDIAVLFSPEAPDDSPGYRRIRETVERILEGRDMPSHTPGGIDWCTLPSFPTEDEQVREMRGFFPFSIFLFDFLESSEILWGEDFRPKMPSPPAPRDIGAKCLDAVLSHMEQLDDASRRARAPFNAFKALQIAQIVFGEETLDKTRFLPLYQHHVPDFPMKVDGEKLIRQYIGAIYPSWLPQMQEPKRYQRLIEQVRDLLPR